MGIVYFFDIYVSFILSTQTMGLSRPGFSDNLTEVSVATNGFDIF